MWNIASRVELLFVLSAVRTNLYFSGPARVLLHTCVSTIDATHLCMCHVQAHEKIDFMNSIIPFLSIYEYLLPSIKCIAHSMIIDNCFQDFIEEFVNLNCVLLYLSILRTYNNNNHQNDYYYYYKIFISFIIYKYVYKVKKKSYNLT